MRDFSTLPQTLSLVDGNFAGTAFVAPDLSGGAVQHAEVSSCMCEAFAKARL